MHNFMDMNHSKSLLNGMLAQGSCLYEVTAADVADLLDSHEQWLANEELEAIDREQSQQKEKEKGKDEELALYVRK